MILCLGTTPTLARTMTFDRVTIDGVNRAKHIHEYAAGKSVNTARVLATLGDDVVATGFVGGERGALVQNDLKKSHVPHDFVVVVPPTRLCVTVVDESAGTATELIEEAKPISEADHDELLSRLMELAPQTRVLVLSGRLAAGGGDAFYADCVKRVGPNTRVIVDAVGEPLLRTLPYRPLIIKPNQSEIAQTLGRNVDSDDELKQAMRELAHRGATWVVTTRGRAGTMLTDGKSFWQLNTPAVKVVSAIGSGDSFAAGLASAIAKGEDVPQACVLAAACGSANAMTPYSGHIRMEDVQELTKQISVTRL